MEDFIKWILGIVSVLLCAAIIAVWRLIAGKADKTDIFKVVKDIEESHKNINLRIDNSLLIVAQAVSKTDLIDKLGVVSTRADDKDLRVQRDITELKMDVKKATEDIRQVDKKLDELPSRVASLEQTRNQSQK